MGTVTKLRVMLCCTAELIQQLPSSHSFLSQLGHLAPYLTPSHPAHPTYIKSTAPAAQQNMYFLHLLSACPTVSRARMTQRGWKLTSYGSESLAWLEHTSSQQAAGNPESYMVLSCSARGTAAEDRGSRANVMASMDRYGCDTWAGGLLDMTQDSMPVWLHPQAS